MNNKIEKLENSQIKITIELNKEEWAALNLEAYNKTRGQYAAQGFRKGKVPKKVLENNYGVGVFFDEAINLAFNKYYYEIIEANTEIYPVGQPELDIENIDENGLIFFAIVPVKPEFELGQYTGIKFEKIEYTVKGEDVDSAIEKMRNEAGRMVEVTDRATIDGDTANINFEGFVDGVAFAGGKGEGYDLVLGSHSFIPGFEEGVVGMKIAEEKSVMVKFPEEYGEASLAGKDAEFKVTLNKISGKELPAVDDEFVKDISEFNTVKELRDDITSKIEAQNKEKASNEMENSMVDKICEGTTVEIPQAMVNSQVDSMVQDFEYRLMYQGMKLDQYLGYIGQSVEEFKIGFGEEAKKQVKSQLVIDKIITAENIVAEDAEIEAKVVEAAAKQKQEVEEFKKNMKPQQLSYIARNVIIEKLFTFLRTSNTIA